MVSFFQRRPPGWWLDWYAPALYLGSTPSARNRFVDPYVEVGMGCAGRVHPLRSCRIGWWSRSLSLALFPFVAGGLSLDLDGLLVGRRVTYTPVQGADPRDHDTRRTRWAPSRSRSRRDSRWAGDEPGVRRAAVTGT